MRKFIYTAPVIGEISIEEQTLLCASETQGNATVIGYDYDPSTYDELD